MIQPGSLNVCRIGQFDLGPAAAFSLVYFLIILLLCFVLYNFMKEQR